MSKKVKVTYNADTLETTITVDGKPFDTSRINGKEIADWAYPFMMRKVKWNGFYEEMSEALGEEAFDLIFEGSEEALAELKEAWEDAPVTVLSGEGAIVTIVYDENTLTTEITVNNQPFDTSRINGREIADWVFPFMMRKVKWDGIFEELTKAVGSEEYTIQFSGSKNAMKELMTECPETVTINFQKSNKTDNSAKTVSESKKETVPTASEETNPASMSEDDVRKKIDEIYGIEDDDVVFRFIKPLAESGHPYAQWALASMYECGWGTDVDEEAAFSWYKKSAEQGDAVGQNSLADCYKLGIGTRQHAKKAAEWYRKSAEQGNRYSQYELGLCYEKEFGVKRNDAEMIKWFKAAAEQGYAPAQYSYGTCSGYRNGPDADEALLWIKKAAEQDEPNAQILLGDHYSDNPAKAKKWYKKAIKSAESAGKTDVAKEARERLLVLQESERAIEKAFDELDRENYGGAARLFKEAAISSGDMVAQYMYGLCLEEGCGVRQDYYEAVKWYRKAADQGDPDAQERLGDCYSEGNGVAQNGAEAVKWYRKATKLGNVDAKAKLGVCYITGKGVEEDFDLGAQLVEEAADEDSEYAIGFIESFNEAYGEDYRERYNDTNKGGTSPGLINRAKNYLKSDEGKEFMKGVAQGAAKAATDMIIKGKTPLQVIGEAAMEYFNEADDE